MTDHAIGPARLGIVTPVLTLVPGLHGEWERSGSIDDVVAVARSADRLGFAHLTCAEHVAVSADTGRQRGSMFWDPLATLSYLAAVTSRIRLATHVLVLGHQHPLALAKRYGTLDRLSGGRLVLGVGVGSLQEEFDLLGTPWTDRGARGDDALRALRAALSRPTATYHGEFYDFDDVILEPYAVQDRIPIWVGGRTRRSLRRAVELGDGWAPFGLRLGDITEILTAAGSHDGLEVVLYTPRPIDPLGDPDAARRSLDKAFAAGATKVNVSLQSTSLQHYLEQMEALRDL
jgi:probable F420-dependent oxidoreductase